ncbi:MAG: DUF2163 domain-containing protein [Pseudomonadota bacterium]
MRDFSTALTAHLQSGATTMCSCWKVTRKDGVVFGFTDHDRDISFDGVAYEAASGATGSAEETSSDLSVDNMSILGALSSSSLTPDALDAGVFDDATVEVFRVNWESTDQRYLARKGSIGEVRRDRNGYAAEVRGLAHYLDQSVGRRYQRGCDAVLGDGRCGVDLSAAAYRGVGAVTSVIDSRRFSVSGLDGFATDWFSRGRLVWTSGANANVDMDVKAHAKGAGVSITLWRPMSADVAVGDAFVVTAGCDKLFATCRDKFSNTVNFRGFHMMPGNDFAQSYPNRGDALDGGKRG